MTDDILNTIEYEWITGVNIGYLLFKYLLAITLIILLCYVEIDTVLTIIFSVTAFYFLYSSLAHTINRTKIVVTTKAIEVRHKPLPWIGGREIELDEIKNFYHLFVENHYYGSWNSIGFIDFDDRNVTMFPAIKFDKIENVLKCMSRLVDVLSPYSNYEIKEILLKE